jgi:hypothetical protein
VLEYLQLWNYTDCSLLAINQLNSFVSSYSLLTIFFFFLSSLQHAEKVVVNVNDLTEPSDNATAKPTQAVKLKVQRGRVTRSQDRPKRDASSLDENDAAPLLANYASAKTSKTLLCLPTVPYVPPKKEQTQA